VRAQARLQQPQVRDELVGVAVGARMRHVVGPPGSRARLEHGAEPAVDVAQLLAVRLPLVAGIAVARLAGERERVLLEAQDELREHADPLRRAEVAVQALDPAAQQPQREVVVRAQRLLGRGHGDERVAVAVAADPAAEAQEAGSTRTPGSAARARARAGATISGARS
jgi:hypothetical protein